ncbi:hypothetical protein [Streptomyces marincola]|uniref:hypothetical protein n=1 Tax=Streptomyces marincola TaxID=2878388 RepID=UPI001CF56B8B|nr:hypothetical protein [Streptomyces marincola]UCM91101.1 hypothetical protein LC193_25895 [Streptomyces marincola]
MRIAALPSPFAPTARPPAPPQDRPPARGAGGLTARRLPPDCEAFLALHRVRYLRYARLHLPGPVADDTVAAVFDHLFMRWRRVLSGANPASYAWHLLTHRTRDRVTRRCAALSPAQYDAYALHHVLGYGPSDVATAMGEAPATVDSLLRSPPVLRVVADGTALGPARGAAAR